MYFQVEGVYVESDRKDKVLELENPKDFCPLCPNKLKMDVKYTVNSSISTFLQNFLF